MSAELEDSYRYCEKVASASNFYNGFRLLPPAKHRAMSAIYAFMRHCDDISDTEGDPAEKAKEFAIWTQTFEQAIRGGAAEHASLPALRDTLQKFEIPPEYFLKLIVGTQMDLTATHYASFQDLYQYCYHVASVVGLICIHVFGFQDAGARDCAEACGVAFQITNILRDIREDLERGRVYIPREDLERFHCSEEDLRRQNADERFAALMAFETSRAQEYYDKARPLFKLIQPDSRRAFYAMMESYETLLRKIRKNPARVLRERVRLKRSEKIRILLTAFLKW